MKTLNDYLKEKPLYCDKIDYEKMPRIFSQLSHHFNFPKIIHIVGTNGKGSTGRFLTQILETKNLKVGHYTSPHILSFNERFYKNKKLITDSELELLHVKTFKIVEKFEKELSYFEYATFLAFVFFSDCDYLILEAGLGGEFDATNVAPKVFSIVTPISKDHQDFLGQTLKDITKTKTNSINNKALIAHQESSDIYEVIKNKEREIQEQFIYLKKHECVVEVENYANKHSLPSFLKDNLYTAYFSAIALGIYPNMNKLPHLNIFGRCEKIAPNITVDVGHNEAAAREILNVFKRKKIILIYNSYADKDFKTVLEILKPIILHVEIIDIEDKSRKTAKEDIKKYLDFLHVKHRDFKEIISSEEYLVFGSFKVVEMFLRIFFEK